MSLPEIITSRELADHLRVSDATVRINAERWGGFRVGKQWRFHRDAVLPLGAPKPATLPSRWQDADAPQSRSTNNPARDDGASDGASTAARSKKVASTPRTRRKTTPTRSVSAFAQVFPEHANHARSAS